MDQSPNVYPAMLRNELENASALDLGDLAHELNCCRMELPGFVGKTTARSMAIAFEAGRRCGVHQAIEMTHPAIRI